MDALNTLASISPATLGANVNAPGVVLIILGAIVAIPVGVLAIIYLIVPAFKGLFWVFRQIFVFIFSMLADVMRLIGALITAIVLIPLTACNVIIGRWSASAHYGRAIQAEFKNMGRSVYRLCIGNPARLLCLTALTDGLENRIPEVMAAAPGADKPSRRLGQFDGYEIVGSLPGGGSGGKLYVAKPDAQRLASFARNGHASVDQVVIKSFSMGDGTTLPQIVRENRALDAAKKLGLILDHEITNDRFFYVMRYVPGESLNLVTQRIHAAAGGQGLTRREVNEVLEYTADLLRTLCHYHDGGLWHKDVKPDNIIVSGGQAHLVDFGLVTPLRSSMTLTTHGTEYFRDPEMVRMALKGAKVHEVDGARFDLYAVGAVLFSMIENSFPAHGGLSQITRPCPESVRWIVRRAMTDYDKRYESAATMLADVETLLRAGDPFSVRVAQLPSVASKAMADDGYAGPLPPPLPPMGPSAFPQSPVQPAFAGAGVNGGWSAFPGMNPGGAGAGAAPAFAAAAARSPQPGRVPSGRMKPDIRVTSWFSGKYHSDSGPAVASPRMAPMPVMQAAPAFSPVIPGGRVPAREQLERARARAAEARQRVQARMNARSERYVSGVNPGVAVAAVAFIGLIVFVVLGMFTVHAAPSSRVIVNGRSSNLPVETGSEMPAQVYPVIVDNRVPAAAPVAATTSVADTSTVLVVCEWSKFDGAQRAQIRRQLKQLEEAGFDLSGDASPADESEAPDANETLAVAELRSQVGTRLFASTDAVDAIRMWLDREHRASLVVWFAAGDAVPTHSDQAVAVLVGSTQTAPSVVQMAASRLSIVQ